MARGHEETSISQAGREGGTSREMPTISSLVAIMSIKELRSFSQVPADIKLEVENGLVAPTIGGVDTSREMPTISSLVAVMSIEELRSFSQVPADIKPEVENGLVSPTIGGVDNVIYFTL